MSTPAQGQDRADEELIADIAAGDRDAFDLLARRHMARIIALAHRLLANRSDAEEVGQEALLRVWQFADRWRPTGPPLAAWINRIVVNLCVDRQRRPRHAPLEAAGDPIDPTPDVTANIERRQTSEQVSAALASLPERQRIALVLCYYERMSNIDSAAMLDISVSALESLLVRGRRSLRDVLTSSRSRSAEDKP